ncbi:MAG TPA: META domain-containing protein [Chitinophagaceae bacterium]|nr:META domain-containing protein [Chitinophagaceae bacterium]
MKLIVLFLVVFMACNQSENKSNSDEKLTPADTVRQVSLTAPKLDSSTIKNSPPAADATKRSVADTAAKKSENPVHESLQNFWALETIDGKALNAKDFPGGTPYLQLNLAKHVVSGYGGCNSINGSIKVEASSITFGQLTTTKSTCIMQEFENNYVNSLSGHKVRYVLQAGRLSLTTEQNKSYIYHKMQ